MHVRIARGRLVRMSTCCFVYGAVAMALFSLAMNERTTAQSPVTPLPAWSPVRPLPPADSARARRLASTAVAPESYPVPPVTAASPTFGGPYAYPTPDAIIEDYERIDPKTGKPIRTYGAAFTSAAEPGLDVQDEVDAPAASTPARPSGTKEGVLQQVRFSGTYLARGGGESAFGMDDLELRGSLAFPFFKRETPLILSPGFGMHYLDGPAIVDLPPSVYDAYLDIRYLRQLTPRVGMDISITPGQYSDFDSGTNDGFRLTGRGLAAIEWTPTTKVILGVVYVNRGDLNVLPVAGMVWIPREETRFELVLPQPRIAQRFGLPDPCTGGAWWGYVGGEFGGGRWAFTDSTGQSDRFTYNDWRFILGVERKNAIGSSVRFETGYVFGRTLQIDSLGEGEIDLTDTVMVRGVAAY